MHDSQVGVVLGVMITCLSAIGLQSQARVEPQKRGPKFFPPAVICHIFNNLPCLPLQFGRFRLILRQLTQMEQNRP